MNTPPVQIGSLLGVVQSNQSDIFITAHPLCYFTQCNPTISVGDDGRGDVVETAAWTGPLSGKAYTTNIIFTPSYNASGGVSFVSIDATETNGPTPAAFQGAESAKWIVLQLASDWLKSKQKQYGPSAYAASVAAKFLDRSVPAKTMVGGIIAYLCNRP